MGNKNMKEKQKHPTEEECRRLWEQYETPEHIRRHCLAVARTARKIAEELNKHGKNLDLELINAAGLTHDLVRLAEDHEAEGARILRELGYEEEADIIAVHMHYPDFSSIDEVNETDLVCLGDRTVIEDRFVGVDKRYQHIIDKAIRLGHPDAEPFILEKKKDVLRFVGEIEALTGKTLEEITKGVGDE